MTHSADIFEDVVRVRREGLPAALATIVATRGSTPGRETMRLLVLEDGTFLGTVGGGCLEADVYETAKQVIQDEVPRTRTYRLTEFEAPESGLVCGGEVTVFVEPITTPALWLFGAGHVSRAICQVAALAGWRVTVADDRAKYATAGRFPEASQVLAVPWEEAVARMPLRAHTYAIVATRGHKEDGLILRELARRERLPRYLGMIGSKTKRAVLFRALREDGVGEEFLGAVRSPMGLCIGARNHEEIAVAVVAELIMLRRQGRDAAADWAARKRHRPVGAEVRTIAADVAGSGS